MAVKAVKNRKHEIDMTEGKLFPKIFAFAVPLILTAVLQLLFNSADMIVVGKFVGNNSVGAVGSTGSLNALLTNFAIGVGTGVVCSLVLTAVLTTIFELAAKPLSNVFALSGGLAKGKASICRKKEKRRSKSFIFFGFIGGGYGNL